MKTFKQFKSELNKFKAFKTPQQISSKHKVSLDYILNQLKIGIPIEHEHTKDEDLAKIIALHHLDEIPDYYTRLKNLEKNAKSKQLKEGTLHHWLKGSRSKTGKPGWVQSDGSPCANEPGETKTPKCFSSGRLKALKKMGKKGKKIIASAVRRKRLKDPEQQSKSSSSKPTMVKTFSKGEKDPNYIKAEPKISKSKKDKPGKGSGTKDACYYKVKSRFSVWPSAYGCVPEHSSKALTKEGWKNVNELNIGDLILTYSLKNDTLEFKPILNIHRYKDAKTNIVQSGNTGFIFECTDDHKWAINIPSRKDETETKFKKINDVFFMTTKELLENNYNKRLLVSAPYNEGNSTKKDLIHKYGDNWVKYILDISEEQRQSWLFSALIYVGHQRKLQRKTEKPNDIDEKFWESTGPYGIQTFRFKQKDKEHRDAFLLSAFLNQGMVTWNNCRNKNIYSCSYVSNKRDKNTSNFRLIEEKISNVWCPETENGTWVMLQETEGRGIITITGNSSALVKCRKMGADNWGNKSSKLKEDYTRLQVNGNTFTILLSWRGIPKMIQMFFPNMKVPSKEEVVFEVNKVYPGAIVLSFKPAKIDPTKPYLITGEK